MQTMFKLSPEQLRKQFLWMSITKERNTNGIEIHSHTLIDNKQYDQSFQGVSLYATVKLNFDLITLCLQVKFSISPKTQ